MLAAARRAGNAGELQYDAGSSDRVRDPGLPRKQSCVGSQTHRIHRHANPWRHFLAFIHLYPSIFFLGAYLTCYERDKHRGEALAAWLP